MITVGQNVPTTMRAVVCHGLRDTDWERCPCRPRGRGRSWCASWGSAFAPAASKCYTGAPSFGGTNMKQGYCQPPIIPGHEFVGEVVALGEGAGEKRRLAAGDP